MKHHRNTACITSSYLNCHTLLPILYGLFAVSVLDVSSECPPGLYGPACDLSCHCANNVCDVNASCVNDTECSKGWYSDTCQKKCGECKGEGKCSKHNGHCLEGCLSGYSGLTCTMACLECKDANNCPGLKGSCFTGCDGVYRCKKVLSTSKPKRFSRYSMIAVNIATIGVIALACLTTYICYKLTRTDEDRIFGKYKPSF